MEYIKVFRNHSDYEDFAASGTFVKNAAAEWDVTGNSGIPTGWTVQKATA